MSEYVIQLSDGSYYIGKTEGLAPVVRFTSGNIHVARKYATQWAALAECAKVGAKIMHEAKIVPYPPPRTGQTGEGEAKPPQEAPE